MHGHVRRTSSFNPGRLDHLCQDPHEQGRRLVLHFADLNDASSLNTVLRRVAPDETYNLGVQSHVKVSFDVPEYTGEVTALGAGRLLEAIRELGLRPRFYQASSSEMFGQVAETPPLHPRGPYGVAKVYAYWITLNYRECYGLRANNGILFNHESPRRRETSVTRKITRAVGSIVHGGQESLWLGNLDAKRDWRFAGDNVEAMWRMLQADTPDDFVVATGETHTVREFYEKAFAFAGITLAREVEAVDETGRCTKTGKILVRVDPRYFRPAEVERLLGDPAKAKKLLGWQPTVTFEGLVEMMTETDLDLAAIEAGRKTQN